MRTDPLGIAEFMAHDVPRQCGIQGLAPAFGALVAGHLGFVAIVVALLPRRSGLGGCGQRLGLVEEHVLLMGPQDFATGSEDLAHHLVEFLLQQVALHTQEAVLASQRIALGLGRIAFGLSRIERLLQGCKSAWRASDSSGRARTSV